MKSRDPVTRTTGTKATAGEVPSERRTNACASRTVFRISSRCASSTLPSSTTIRSPASTRFHLTFTSGGSHPSISSAAAFAEAAVAWTSFTSPASFFGSTGRSPRTNTTPRPTCFVAHT